MLSGGEFDGAFARLSLASTGMIFTPSIDSFPSMMMAYYTEKARKKQARKQRGADTHSKG